MRRIILCAFLFVIASAIPSLSQSATPCPADFVCISREVALKAVADDATVKAQATELSAKDKAITDLRDELNKMRIEYAEARGELTALKQNAVSDRAIITAMIPMLRQKKVGLINLF